MNSKIIKKYFNIFRWLFNYVTIAILAAFEFIIDLFTIQYSPNMFCILFAIGSTEFFVILVIIGSGTYKYLSRFDGQTSKLTHENVRIETENGNVPLKNGHAPQTVFYRIYEVVAALSIYEASKGVIFSATASNVVISPLSELFHEPVEFLMFLIFIIISIQFIVGVSKHFESDFSFSSHVSVYAIINYILIVGEAVSLLAMGISVSSSNIPLFSLWFIALLVIDYFWVLLFKIFRVGVFGFKNVLGLKIDSIESIGIEEKSVYLKVNTFWIFGNIAFIIYLSIMDPVAKGYIDLPGNFYEIYISFMLVGVSISTFINSKCLSALEKI